MRTPHQFSRLLQAILLLVIAGLGPACQQVVEPLALRCDISLSDISPEEASPGNTVTATGTPLTTVWDTAIYVGDTRASLLTLERDQCTLCDECRSNYMCTACSACKECADTCRNTCTETLSFIVPVLPGGSHNVSMFNRHGQSNPLSLAILPSPDTGMSDSGLTDTADMSTDSGASSTPPSDTSTTDTGSTDSGATTPEDTATP